MGWLDPTLHNAPPEQAARLRVAMSAALAAGDTLLQCFERGVTARDKADGTPVTDADLEAETIIRNAIFHAFPDDGQLGEEHGEHTGTNDWRWVIDPIDGTVSFMHGVPVFGTLIGIEHKGTPVAGVMHYPALHETAWATTSGAWWRRGDGSPQSAHVSTTTELKDATVCATSLEYFDDAAPLLCVNDAVKRTRGWSDCHASLLLVTGRIDAVLEPQLKPWDICAVIAVLHAAGGRFSDWSGKHGNTSSTPCGLSSNGHLHQALLECLG